MTARLGPRSSSVVKAVMSVAALAVLVVHLSGDPYHSTVATLAGIYAIVAVGLNLLTGYTGQISFGQSAFVAVGAYFTAIGTTRWGLAPITAMALGALASGAVAGLVGWSTLRLRGYYLGFATGALALMATNILIGWRDVTGGYIGIGGIPDLALGPVELRTPFAFALFAWLIAALALTAVVVLIRSPAGLALRAVRGSDTAAAAVGVNVTRTKIHAFVVSAVFAAVGGSLWAHFLGFISPELFTINLALSVLTMVFVGGSGTTAGPVVGAVVIAMVSEFLGSGRYTGLTYSLALLVVLLLAPTGVVGLWLTARRRVGGSGRRQPVVPTSEEPPVDAVSKLASEGVDR